MGDKVSIRELYKIQKKVTLKDNSGNEADVIIRVVPSSVKREALKLAKKERASYKRKLAAKDSDEALLLEEEIESLSVEDLQRELSIFKEIDIKNELYPEIADKDIYKDCNDLDSNEKFNKELDSAVEKQMKKYNSNLSHDENELRRLVRDIRARIMLDSFFLQSFNETIILHALRNPDNPDEKIFKDIDEMMENLHGGLFMELIGEYFSLDNKSGDDVKK